MKKIKFRFRNISASIAACLVITAMFVCVFSCEKNEEKVFSPPKWIKGEWEYYDFLTDVFEYKLNFKFTTNDVIFLSSAYGSISYSFYDLYKDKNYLIEETNKTDEIYEISFTHNGSKKILKFKKGDDNTSISYDLFDTGAVCDLCNDIIMTLYKK